MEIQNHIFRAELMNNQWWRVDIELQHFYSKNYKNVFEICIYDGLVDIDGLLISLNNDVAIFR